MHTITVYRNSSVIYISTQIYIHSLLCISMYLKFLTVFNKSSLYVWHVGKLRIFSLPSKLLISLNICRPVKLYLRAVVHNYINTAILCSSNVCACIQHISIHIRHTAIHILSILKIELLIHPVRISESRVGIRI